MSCLISPVVFCGPPNLYGNNYRQTKTPDLLGHDTINCKLVNWILMCGIFGCQHWPHRRYPCGFNLIALFFLWFLKFFLTQSGCCGDSCVLKALLSVWPRLTCGWEQGGVNWYHYGAEEKPHYFQAPPLHFRCAGKSCKNISGWRRTRLFFKDKKNERRPSWLWKQPRLQRASLKEIVVLYLCWQVQPCGH